MKAKLYLDARRYKEGKPCPLKICIAHRNQQAYISLGVSLLPSQWDAAKEKVVKHQHRAQINFALAKRMLDVEEALAKLGIERNTRCMTAMQIKEILEAKDKGTLFAPRLIRFANKHKASTCNIYMETYRKMEAFCDNFDALCFEDITTKWLVDFDVFLLPTHPSKNARNKHMRNIRAVFNDALDDELITCYPFRKFKIRPVPTAKRSLSVDELRLLWDYPVEEFAVMHRDMFKLIFLLIGINMADLYRLTEITGEGRIEYTRMKTGRAYSIKVEPEAKELIEKYRGEKNLICIADTYAAHEYYTPKINMALKKIGGLQRVGLGGKKIYTPLFPKLSVYWARHTWATIAASLDIPKETIAAALGHGGNTVTDIYIDFDRKKIDEANRRVIDYVLYDKK